MKWPIPGPWPISPGQFGIRSFNQAPRSALKKKNALVHSQIDLTSSSFVPSCSWLACSRKSRKTTLRPPFLLENPGRPTDHQTALIQFNSLSAVLVLLTSKLWPELSKKFHRRMPPGCLALPNFGVHNIQFGVEEKQQKIRSKYRQTTPGCVGQHGHEWSKEGSLGLNGQVLKEFGTSVSESGISSFPEY